MAHPASVAELRGAVMTFLEQHDVGPDQLGDVAVAVSEALTNAVIHAYANTEPGPIDVSASIVAGRITVTVTDHGIGMGPRRDSPGLGIGLPLIGRLTSSVDIRENPAGPGTEVRMRFEAPGLAGPPPPDPESDRAALLARVAQVTEAPGWPGDSYDELMDLLVPGVAIACTLDVLEDGCPQRLAARVGGPHGAELSRWLSRRRPVPQEIEATVETLRNGEPRVLEINEQTMAHLAGDEDDLRQMRRLPLRAWVNVPLVADGELFGALGLGIAADAPDPAPQLGFLRAIAERAARGIAQARLMAELRAAGSRFERILAGLGAAVTVHDSRGKMVYANEAAVELLGASSLTEILAAEPGQFAARFDMRREDGTPITVDDLPGRRLARGEDAPRLLTRSVELVSGRAYWLLTTATMVDPERGLIANIIEDVTESKTNEIRQRVLAEAGELFVAPMGFDETLDRLCRLLVPVMADWCALDLIEGDSVRRVGLYHSDPEKLELAKEMYRRWPPSLDEGATANAVRMGRTQVFVYVTDDMLAEAAQDAEHLDYLRRLGVRSGFVIPLQRDGATVATMTLASAESRRRFDESDIQFGEDLARRVAAALEAASARDRD